MTKVSGFTLIELLITIAIAAILLAAAVPALRGMLEQLRVSGHANAFIEAVGQARSEALRRGENVRVSAIPVSGSADSFANGWCVHLGPDCADGTDQALVLGRQQALHGTSVQTDAAAAFLEFDRFGMKVAPDSVAGAAAVRIALFPQRFASCVAALAHGRRLEVLGSGRIAVIRPQTAAECPS